MKPLEALNDLAEILYYLEDFESSKIKIFRESTCKFNEAEDEMHEKYENELNETLIETVRNDTPGCYFSIHIEEEYEDDHDEEWGLTYLHGVIISADFNITKSDIENETVRAKACFIGLRKENARKEALVCFNKFANDHSEHLSNEEIIQAVNLVRVRKIIEA